MNSERQTLKCDCCGKEGLAYLDGNRLIITKRKNRRDHTMVLDLNQMLDKYAVPRQS
jgi:hypothetical protein